MNHNNPLQNNVNNTHDRFVDNRFNNYSSTSTNVINMEQHSTNSLCNYTDFSATEGNNMLASYATNNYEQQTTFSFLNNEHVISTTQSYSTITSSYAPQYIDHNVNQNPPQYIQNTSQPLNFPQTNNSQIFRFEVPGFKIIIIPTTSSILTSLDMQIESHNVSFSNNTTDNSQTQFRSS
ncbi:hypothetical protein C1645_834868 [Glomus cerebriforme]|uniref:Uncharacterized protein n=1 Tax=Glomus cerebriforme TaxID=658196 RepID=A0A397SIX5_9GLOM|nr:hypothetical protein C1645_834868 [Glomus cerebriforme]